MGDRASVAVVASWRTHSGHSRGAVWFFTNWRGEGVPERIRVALQRSRGRYAEPRYMARILWDAVQCDGWGEVDGYGLGLRPLDTEPGRPCLVVDLDERTIGTSPLDRLANIPKVGRTISWNDYVSHGERTWKNLLS